MRMTVLGAAGALLTILTTAGCVAKPTMNFSVAIQQGDVAEVRSNLFWERMCTVKGPIDKTGRTPLHAAAQFGQPKVAEYLIKRGADVNSLGYWSCGKTPLHLAARNGRTEMIRLLLTAGADATIKNRQGKLPATVASEAGHQEIAKLLGE